MDDTLVPLDADVPESVRAFVAERIEPVLADVRCLLAQPRKPGGRGSEAASVPALFSVLGGLSRVFFHDVTGDRPSFAAVAERYPTGDEPAHAIKDPKLFAEGLYLHYQASLVHGLGLHMRRDGRYEPWRLAPARFGGRDLRLAVERLQALADGDRLVASLDAPSGWPAGVGPTLSLTTESLRLEVDAFYCGLRRLVLALAVDAALRPAAVAVLEPWYAEHRRLEGVRTAAILEAPAARGAGGGMSGSPPSVGAPGRLGAALGAGGR